MLSSLGQAISRPIGTAMAAEGMVAMGTATGAHGLACKTAVVSLACGVLGGEKAGERSSISMGCLGLRVRLLHLPYFSFECVSLRRSHMDCGRCGWLVVSGSSHHHGTKVMKSDFKFRAGNNVSQRRKI